MKRFIAFVSVGALIWTFGCRGERRLQGLSTSDGFVKIGDNVHLYFKSIGEGSDVIIIPAAAYLEYEFERLAAKDRTLIFYDMRNRGRSCHISNASQISMDNEVSDLECLRQHLGKEKVSLIGWSYLGAMVILYALEYPERVSRIIQIGPLPPTQALFAKSKATPMDEKNQARLNKMKEEALESTVPETFCKKYWEIYLKRIFYDPEKISHFRSDKCKFENEMPDNVNFQLGAVIDSLGKWDWLDKLNAIKIPVLTIHGDSDPTCPLEGSRTWVAWLQTARLFIVPNAGHMPFVEDPDLFYSAVNTFLKGEWPENSEIVGVPVYLH
ncbi:MAG: alpha/beta hydrolase [Candidatus Aminicenantes bacterium]|nr:alpha/beta hydrolase [Candidatus Aminicenantes bacterium]